MGKRHKMVRKDDSEMICMASSNLGMALGMISGISDKELLKTTLNWMKQAIDAKLEDINGSEN